MITVCDEDHPVIQNIIVDDANQTLLQMIIEDDDNHRRQSCRPNFGESAAVENVAGCRK